MSNSHITDIEDMLRLFSEIDTHHLKAKSFPSKKVYISGSITFTNGHQLAFTEVLKVGADSKAKYRYQYMDEKQVMIFRYDNAQHHQHLSNFPHHKHTAAQIIASEEPSLRDILLEITELMRDSGQ